VPDTKASLDQALSLIDLGTALREPPEDPAASVLGPARLVDREPHRIQGGCGRRACDCRPRSSSFDVSPTCRDATRMVLGKMRIRTGRRGQVFSLAALTARYGAQIVSSHPWAVTSEVAGSSRVAHQHHQQAADFAPAMEEARSSFAWHFDVTPRAPPASRHRHPRLSRR
jgi:hypothetical protein